MSGSVTLDPARSPHPGNRAVPVGVEDDTDRRVIAGEGVDVARVEALYRQLLDALGLDTRSPGLKDTPRRVAAWWEEFLNYDPGIVDTTFEHAPAGRHLVVQRQVGAWSVCEHHLLPMRLEVAIGYVPHHEVLGLSKLARIVQAQAHRLQLQERLCRDVATDVASVTGSGDVAVRVDGEHLCMSMRGVRAETARTTTTVFLGRLESDPRLADQFMACTGNPS